MSPRYKTRLFIQFFSLAMTDKDFAAVVRQSYERQALAMAEKFAAIKTGAPRDNLALAASLMALIDGFSLHRILGFFPEGLAPHGDLARDYLSSVMGLGSDSRGKQ